MLNDKSHPCNEDPKYKKDNCAEDEIEKFVMKEYGCIPPFFENKENICIDETISKQVWKYWHLTKYYTNCPDPCKVMLIRATAERGADEIRKDSRVKLSFRSRVKVVESYYNYSGLSLIAEIGGYFGLFLGVSINQITHVTSMTSYIQERFQKYF